MGEVLLSTLEDSEILRIVCNVNALDAGLLPAVNAQARLSEIHACRRTGFAFSVDA